MEQGLKYATGRFQELFAAIAAVSAGAPPPGKNVANGFFRDRMVGNKNAHPPVGQDAGIIRCGRSAEADHVVFAPGSDGQFMFERYMQFYNGNSEMGGIVKMFEQAANVGGDTTLQIVWDNISQIAAVIVDLVKGIVAALGGEKEGIANAVKGLEADTKSLLDKINNSGNVKNGEHMSGWLSQYAKAPEIHTLGELDKKWPSGTKSDAGVVTEVLRKTFRAVEGLSEKDHNPWLKAEWQISFQTILQGASIALDSVMKRSPSASAARCPVTLNW